MRPNEFQYEWSVTNFDELTRIDKFVASGFDEYSRTMVQKMIAEEYIICNGHGVKPNYQVKVGDIIQIEELPITMQDALPENIPLDIVYEDDDLLVVNKPTGMVVHPAPGHYTGTLVNALLYHIDHLSSGSEIQRPGIVHRIDKDTSGLLMVAKNDFTHRALSSELKEKTTKREYVAIVDGVILNQMGSINAPIGRSKTDRKKMTVVEDGKEAKTHFEVLERFEKETLISCRLETGRTHQIRVHMAYINFPLLGDPVYGKSRHTASTGQYLHAKLLGFTHPRTNEWMEFDSALPDYFTKKIEELRNR